MPDNRLDIPGHDLGPPEDRLPTDSEGLQSYRNEQVIDDMLAACVGPTIITGGRSRRQAVRVHNLMDGNEDPAQSKKNHRLLTNLEEAAERAVRAWAGNSDYDTSHKANKRLIEAKIAVLESMDKKSAKERARRQRSVSGGLLA